MNKLGITMSMSVGIASIMVLILIVMILVDLVVPSQLGNQKPLAAGLPCRAAAWLNWFESKASLCP